MWQKLRSDSDVEIDGEVIRFHNKEGGWIYMSTEAWNRICNDNLEILYEHIEEELLDAEKPRWK